MEARKVPGALKTASSEQVIHSFTHPCVSWALLGFGNTLVSCPELNSGWVRGGGGEKGSKAAPNRVAKIGADCRTCEAGVLMSGWWENERL